MSFLCFFGCSHTLSCVGQVITISNDHEQRISQWQASHHTGTNDEVSTAEVGSPGETTKASYVSTSEAFMF